MLILLPRPAQATQLHVRIDQAVYPYLERLAARGYLPDYQDETLPHTRVYIARQLEELHSRRAALSPLDRRLLDEFRADFRKELSPAKHFRLESGQQTYFALSSLGHVRRGIHDMLHYQPGLEEHHLLVYESDQDLVWLDLDEMVRVEFKNGTGRFITQNALRFSSQAGSNFCLYSDAYIYDQQVRAGFEEPAREFKGGALPVKERAFNYTSAAFDYSTAYVSYNSALGRLELGVEPILWGNSRRSLILSDNVDPFAFVRWQKNYGRSGFNFFHGFIKPAEEQLVDSTSGKKALINKYIVGHRWDFKLSNNLRLGLTEMLVYGDRGPEPAYFIPVLFLWPIQHSLTKYNDDNILWICDGEYTPVPGIRFYGTLLIDNITTSKLFQNSMENMTGVQGGIYITPGRLGQIPWMADYRVEFTALRPWVYAHRSPLQSSYTHNGRPLGFPAGPNSQLWFMENRWWLSPRQALNFSILRSTHGSNPVDTSSVDYYPIGDDANQNTAERNRAFDMKTRWLMGDLSVSTEYGITWQWQLSNVITTEIRYTYRILDGDVVTYYSLQFRFDY